MPEWELELSEKDTLGEYRDWRYRGEGELLLRTATWYQDSRPYLSLVRIIRDAGEAATLPKDMRKKAAELIESMGCYAQPILITKSPMEMEKFCRDSLLPLPNGYRELLPV